MKFTIVFTTLMCVSTSWAVLAKKVEEPKDKREAAVSYGAPGHSGHSYQAPASYSQGDASAISVGAGYSIGGAKPSYGFGGQSSGEGLSPNGHATIQLAPITLQPGHGAFAAGDLSQLMSQLTHSLNAGGLSLQPSNAIAEFHQGGEGVQGAAGHGQELSIPQFTYGTPKFELSQQLSAAPAYSAGTKGLGSYTSTGPVLFTPSESHGNQAQAAPSVTYGAASSGQSLGDAGSYSFGGAGAGHALGGSGHSFGGAAHSLGNSGHSLGGSGHSFGGHSLSGLGGGSGHALAGLGGGSGHSLAGLSSGSGHSLAGLSGGSGHSLSGLSGGSGHSLGGLSIGGAGHSFGSGAYKQLTGGYGAPSKTSFKPSAFLGASVQGESGHGISSLSGSYSAPSFSFRGGHGGASLGSAGHGASFGGSLGGFGSGSSKFIAPSYQSVKSEGLEGASALSSGHFASPPGTTYGIPSSSYSNNAHAASSNRPYYVSTKLHRASPGSFGQGSSAYRAPVSSQSSYSSEPKYSFGGSSFHYEPSDAHGSASETSYNTIKYSEELKPRAN